MPEPRLATSKRSRDSYSRLICLGCRERRIRCELPNDVEAPDAGELRTVQTPCYRCKRLGIPCVIRRTILGRPSTGSDPTATANFRPGRSEDVVSRIVVEFPPSPRAPSRLDTERHASQITNNLNEGRTKRPALINLPSGQGYRDRNALLLHTPQSAERIVIIRALDTIRSEKVENEWFRHLPAHFGHTRALDLSIKALVAACAYSRGVPKLTSSDCYQALALAIHAVQAHIKKSRGKPDDHILASTALLAPFEGVVKKNGVPTRLHVEGLAAILAARPPTYPVTQLAKEIVDFNVGEAAVMACIRGTLSPFENVARAYLVNDRSGSIDNDRARLKGLANELFTCIPRLVRLVRSLRVQSPLQSQPLMDAQKLSQRLSILQDADAESRLLLNTRSYPSDETDESLLVGQNLKFASIGDFEALAYYWQSRLSLLRLDMHLQHLLGSRGTELNNIKDTEFLFCPNVESRFNEISRLGKAVLMCSRYASALPLRRHDRLFAHAMVVVWGVNMDVSAALHTDHCQAMKESLPNFLIQAVNVALEAKPGLTTGDMDTAAEIFVGGPLEGRFANLYGL